MYETLQDIFYGTLELLFGEDFSHRVDEVLTAVRKSIVLALGAIGLAIMAPFMFVFIFSKEFKKQFFPGK